MAGFKDDLPPLFRGLGGPEEIQLGAVGGKFPYGKVVKLEDVLDELLGGRVKDALLVAPVHHHFDFFLADLVLVGAGVHPQQTEDAVGGGGEHCHHRGADGGEGGDEPDRPRASVSAFFMARRLGTSSPKTRVM